MEKQSLTMEELKKQVEALDLEEVAILKEGRRGPDFCLASRLHPPSSFNKLM